jgi:hypothetical protein
MRRGKSAASSSTGARRERRSTGLGAPRVAPLVLETDGSFSVVRREPATTALSLRDVVDERGDRSATAAGRHIRS